MGLWRGLRERGSSGLSGDGSLDRATDVLGISYLQRDRNLSLWLSKWVEREVKVHYICTYMQALGGLSSYNRKESVSASLRRACLVMLVPSSSFHVVRLAAPVLYLPSRTMPIING